jgi:hypothetical protein
MTRVQPVCGHIICADLDRCAFTAQPTRPYRESMIHVLTVAAIHTPAGQPIPDPRATHDANCSDCRA